MAHHHENLPQEKLRASDATKPKQGIGENRQALYQKLANTDSSYQRWCLVCYHHIVKGFSHCIQVVIWFWAWIYFQNNCHVSQGSDCVICFQMNVTKYIIKDKSELIQINKEILRNIRIYKYWTQILTSGIWKIHESHDQPLCAYSLVIFNPV